MHYVLRPAVRTLSKPTEARNLHFSNIWKFGLTNIINAAPPLVQVRTITSEGVIQLANGMNLPGASIFLGGKVFLWDVPSILWKDWDTNRFRIFEVVVPKPEILIFGTGQRTAQLPPHLRTYLRKIGIQTDVMDTRNACSTYNLLAEEGRNVAAALLPLTPISWQKES